MSAFELEAMREWLADCAGTQDVADFWLDKSDDGATEAEVVRAVKRSYAGGMAGFLETLNTCSK